MVAVAALIRSVARMKMAARLGMLDRMDHSVRFPCLVVVAAALLAGCGTMRSSVVIEPAAGSYSSTAAVPSPHVARTPIPGGSYVVAKGDTLYSIAFRKGVDFRDLAQWNAIAAPYTIWPGQRLTLSPPAATKPALARTPGTAAGSPRVSGVAATAPVFEPVTEATPAAAATAAARPAIPSDAPVAHAPAAVDTVPVAGVSVTPPAKVPPVAKPVAAGPARDVGGVSWRWPVEGGSVVGRFNGNDAIPGIEIAGNSGDPVRAAADGVVVYSGNGLVGYGELVIIKHSEQWLSAYGHNRSRLVNEGQLVKAGEQIAEMGRSGAARDMLHFEIRKGGKPIDPLPLLPRR